MTVARDTVTLDRRWGETSVFPNVEAWEAELDAVLPLCRRSVYPLDALQDAGVDLRSPVPVESTFAVLSSLVDRIEQLVRP